MDRIGKDERTDSSTELTVGFMASPAVSTGREMDLEAFVAGRTGQVVAVSISGEACLGSQEVGGLVRTEALQLHRSVDSILCGHSIRSGLSSLKTTGHS